MLIVIYKTAINNFFSDYLVFLLFSRNFIFAFYSSKSNDPGKMEIARKFAFPFSFRSNDNYCRDDFLSPEILHLGD